MKTGIPGRTARLVLRLLLGGIFFYAGFSKLKSMAELAESIANFRLLSAVANQCLAVVLPWCELSVGALLIFGVWIRAAGLLAILLTSAFAVAVSSAIWRGLDIQCGCFGTDSMARVGLQTLGLDVFCLLMALFLVKIHGDY